MDGQELQALAIEFLQQWEYHTRLVGSEIAPFEKTGTVRKLVSLGFIARHINPRQGEYAIQYTHVGVAFFTGTGELAFTEQGLLFAKKICDIMRRRGDRDIRIVKTVY